MSQQLAVVLPVSSKKELIRKQAHATLTKDKKNCDEAKCTLARQALKFQAIRKPGIVTESVSLVSSLFRNGLTQVDPGFAQV